MPIPGSGFMSPASFMWTFCASAHAATAEAPLRILVKSVPTFRTGSCACCGKTFVNRSRFDATPRPVSLRLHAVASRSCRRTAGSASILRTFSKGSHGDAISRSHSWNSLLEGYGPLVSQSPCGVTPPPPEQLVGGHDVTRLGGEVASRDTLELFVHPVTLLGDRAVGEGLSLS